jgi:hypothetical protein
MTTLKLLLCVLLGVCVGFVARGFIHPVEAQVLDPLMMEMPAVYSGTDVGFRVHSHGPSGPRGRVVVRVDGRWQEAHIMPLD